MCTAFTVSRPTMDKAQKEVRTSKYFKPSPKIDDAEWQAIEREEGLMQPDSIVTDALPLCERPLFESMVGIAIMFNALFMAVQLDLTTAKTKVPFQGTDWFFSTLFVGEIFFRIWCLGLTGFFKDKKHHFDIVLVAFNITDSAIQLAGSSTTGLQAFSALRILRLFKIVKLLRVVSVIEDLHLIVVGLISALKSLRWVAIFLVLVVFIAAIVLKILVGNDCDSPAFQQSFIYHFGSDIDPIEKCGEYWGTVLRSMYTLYQVTTLESWSQVIVRPILDVEPMYVVLMLGFQLLTTFGLLNIVVAAVVDGTMNSSDEYVVERKMIKVTVSHLEIIRDIFEKSVGSNGKVTADNFLPLLADPSIRRRLLTMEISYDDPSQILRIIDANGTGAVSLTELTRGFMRMRGSAKSKDLLAIRALVYRCHHEQIGEMHEIKLLESKFEKLSQDLRQDLKDMLAHEKENKQMQMLPSEGAMRIAKSVLASEMAVSNSQICDQAAKIRARIDSLHSSFNTKVQDAAALTTSPLPPSTHMCLNVSMQSSMGVPVSLTTALGESMQLEYSRQLQQLQFEFQKLQAWLEAPIGLQAYGDSKQMQNPFKGDQPLEEELCLAGDGCPSVSVAMDYRSSPQGNHCDDARCRSLLTVPSNTKKK